MRKHGLAARARREAIDIFLTALLRNGKPFRHTAVRKIGANIIEWRRGN